MSEFTIHNIGTAPQNSVPLLKNAEQQLGFIPNLMAVMAESPATLEAYQTLNRLFDKTAFTSTEQQLTLLIISRYRSCCYCLAAHGALANMKKVPPELVSAVYYKQPLSDAKLEALRTFTLAVLDANGEINAENLKAFYQAGYQKRHVLEVVLAISFKTLSNYINHINDTPIDTMFLPGIPDNHNCQAGAGHD